jgi:1-acyl-sn-glycerol-3-phosphate acyltransferase
MGAVGESPGEPTGGIEAAAQAESSKREAGQLYTIAKAVLRPVFWFAWRINATGLENVPREGPAIMCPNHISFIDSLFLPAVLDRRITYVGKAEYLDSWKTKYLFPALGMIPIDRTGGDAAQAALDAAARVLGRGELFGIYPEGTRSRDGRLHKGHTGAARLALRTGAPLIPVGFVGTDRIQPADKPMPRLFLTAQVNIGRPIDVSRYRDRVNDRLVLRQLTDEVVYEIRELSGQEYVDTYATKQPDIPRETTVVSAVHPDGADADGNGADGGNGSDGASVEPRSSADVLRSGT